MSKRTGIMLAYPFEEKRLAKWKPPYFVQPKFDGDRCRAEPMAGGYLLLSSEENVFYSVPHINKALEFLWSEHLLPYPFPELDGELYWHGKTWEEIHSIASRTVNLHPDHENVRFHIFDLANGKPQFDRLFKLNDLKGQIAVYDLPIEITPTYYCESFDDVMRRYDQILEDGYEGIVVRHSDAPYIRKRSIYMMKFKPKKEDLYKITGYKEEVSIHGELKGRLGAFICVGSDGNEFSVGSGLTDDQRAQYWKNRELLPGCICRVAYQHITSGKKVPRFPVFIEVIKDA